ncbi:MAG: transporter substrate-binding domain-containing protein, partial [Firmicutes bacterium]|nr:transporter substrate-binding domain-containing protein [Bacillota bacterium]
MKKILALILAVMMMACVFAGCGEAASEAADGDLAYIESNGKLVVGITSYEPMNYQDENGEWTGFDTEFALAVGEKLDLDIEFKEIEWDNKWQELESKKIDCVWNGMTITDEAKANASVTDAYVVNAQVIVCKAEAAVDLADAAALEGKIVAAEVSSAGYQVGTDAGLEIVEYGTQADAVMAVESGKADACIIDITMANAMTGEGTNYANLAYGLALTSEEYGVAVRKESDLTAKFNE